MKKSWFKFSVEDITEGGILVSIALVLNFLKIPVGATGGSINLQMLPLFLYSLRKGVYKGFIISGIVYGCATCFSDYSGTLMNFPFDYLIGFGSACIFGAFSSHFDKNSRDLQWILMILLCGILATIIRLIGSTLSSMIVYGYPFIPALIYNLTYIPLSCLISAFCIFPLKKVVTFNNKVD